MVVKRVRHQFVRHHRAGMVGATLAVAGLLVVACGDDDETGATTAVTTTTMTDSTTSDATTVPPTTLPPTASPSTTAASTTSAPPPPSSSPTTTAAGPVVLEQPAIWPAADVVFTTPEAAAQDFVAQALIPGPVLGAFMAGDSRSGEMEILSPGEGANPVEVPRGLLLLRQLGPDDGWFVTSIANDEASITAPAQGAVVPAGPLTVEGVGHGFEANLVAKAFIAGDAATLLDMEVTLAGTMEEAGPFTVTLDLSAAQPGDTVMLLINTGAGLETDPGELGAIAVTIGEP